MAPSVVSLHKMTPNACEKHISPFLGGHTKKGHHDLCGRKFVGKNRTKLSRQVSVNSGKNLLHPQKFACSYTYEWWIK